MSQISRVGELLLVSFQGREESKSLVRTGGEMASGRGNVRRAKAVDQGDGQIAECRQNLRGIAGAQAGAVFPEGHIAYIMGTILDAPMPTVELQQTLWTGFAGSQSRDEIDQLSGRGVGFGDHPGELGHLCDEGPARSEIGVHLGTNFDAAHFDASPSTVHRLGLQVAGLRVSKIGGQVRVKGGLIAFDGQDGLGPQRMHEAHEFSMRVQGIGSTHPPDYVSPLHSARVRLVLCLRAGGYIGVQYMGGFSFE
jgi:hypothetical protein